MRNEDVKKLAPLDRFMYWCRERYQIALRRRAEKPKPWTDDEVLQNYFFTHPYREMDKVTVWFRVNVRDPLRDSPRVLFATVAFRWFNLPETADTLRFGDGPVDDYNLLLEWNPDEALRRLGAARDRGVKIFTGAYMINSPGGEPKLEAIVRRIDNVWREHESLLDGWRKLIGINSLTLEAAHSDLTRFDGMGGFMAYEVVCDLRYTYLLEHAPDKLSWCNPGPGAVRGLYRLLGKEFPKGNNASSPPVPDDWTEKTQWLLGECRRRLRNMPAFEMREVEHSLCEWDKYERLLWGDGRAKRKFKGV